MLEKIMEYCKTRHNFVFDDSFSVYELVIKCIEKINEVIDFVNTFQSQMDAKEDSNNITNNRKLDENGNFTGTVCGKNACEIPTEIDGNYDKIQFLSNQFDDGATGLVIECGYFQDDLINKNYDGGVW